VTVVQRAAVTITTAFSWMRPSLHGRLGEVPNGRLVALQFAKPALSDGPI
jgi:hypothetical protein